MSSDFNPLGSFAIDAPLNPKALSAGIAFRHTLPVLPPNDVDRIYLHQSAEEYGCVDDAYHAVVRLDTAVAPDAWEIAPSHDVHDNARSTFSVTDYAEHTYCRNEGAVAIALDGLIGAQVSPNDFGSEPIQMHEVEFLCAGAAAFAVTFGIDTGGFSRSLGDARSRAYVGEPNILTHAEAANLPGSPVQYASYGPAPIGTVERWDLATLIAAPAGVLVTATHASIVGIALRKRIHLYAAAMKGAR
jgi:hypothetical protein